MVPNLFFKHKAPSELPNEMEGVVGQLMRSKEKEVCLKEAYSLVIERFHGCHVFENVLGLFTTKMGTL
mgnify:CR=1 FL=1